jgi:phage baseplate assembly protein V
MNEYFARRVVNSIKVGTIEHVTNTTKMQGVQVSGYADELYQNIDRFQDYGFSSVLLPKSADGQGSEAVIVSPGMTCSRSIVVRADDRRYRPTGGIAGDVQIYSYLDSPSASNAAAQHRIALDTSSGRAIHIRAANANSADVSLTDEGTITLTATGAQIAAISVDQSGTITASNQAGSISLSPAGVLTFNGSNVVLNSNLTVNGTITSTGNIVGAGISLNSHTHSGVQNGSGNTGGPE